MFVVVYVIVKLLASFRYKLVGIVEKPVNYGVPYLRNSFVNQNNLYVKENATANPRALP